MSFSIILWKDVAEQLTYILLNVYLGKFLNGKSLLWFDCEFKIWCSPILQIILKIQLKLSIYKPLFSEELIVIVFAAVETSSDYFCKEYFTGIAYLPACEQIAQIALCHCYIHCSLIQLASFSIMYYQDIIDLQVWRCQSITWISLSLSLLYITSSVWLLKEKFGCFMIFYGSGIASCIWYLSPGIISLTSFLLILTNRFKLTKNYIMNIAWLFLSHLYLLYIFTIHHWCYT